MTDHCEDAVACTARIAADATLPLSGQPPAGVALRSASSKFREPDSSHIEMPKLWFPLFVPAPHTALDAADIVLHNPEALRVLLERVAERARRKDLDRATFAAARELAKAVHAYGNY